MAVEPQPSSARQLVRRFLAPFASPIDGRVADINRRITETREGGDRLAGRVAELEIAVASFAEASTESTSYVGVELGRISGELSAMHDQVAEFAPEALARFYRSQLHAAERRPLSELDGDLAATLNHAAGHRGFAAQADLWFNPPVTVELSAGGARLASTNERLVEVPFAMMALQRLSDGARILDVGSAESTFPLSAASLGYAVTAVDPRGLPYSHPSLNTVAGTVEDLPAPPPAERFDAVFLISTIEHVGLPAYGITPHGDVVPGQGADRELLQRISAQLLAPDGIVVITTPYGERGANDFERTYDDAALDALLDGWSSLTRQIVSRRDELTWEPPPAGPRMDGTGGVAMVVATPASAR